MVVHPLDAEDGFGDVAVASAVHPPVNRLQHVAGAAALLGGQAGVGGNRATEPGAQQPGDGVQPIRAILVERNQGGERLIGGGWGKPEPLKPVAVAKVDMEMQAVFALADGISVLAYGRVIVIGTVDAIRSHPEVRKAYLGEDELA